MDEELRFEWDAVNFAKLASSGRGLTPELCDELARNDLRLFVETRQGRTGDYWIIAPDDAGRFWTIVVIFRGDGLWGPISGWPSTNRQVRDYYTEEGRE